MKYFCIIILCISFSFSLIGCNNNEFDPTINEADNLNVTADFIQSWMCNDWEVADFDAHLEKLVEIGIETLIFQSSANYLEGEIISCSFSGLESEYCSDDFEYNSSLSNLLIAAKKIDFKIVIGLGFDDEWWDESSYTLSNIMAWATLDSVIAEYIYDTYFFEYSNIIWGWYWPWEMYTSDYNYSDSWANMLETTIDLMELSGNNLPVMVSPYHSTYNDVNEQRVYEVWKLFFEEYPMREQDVFCPQDGFGATPSEYDIEEIQSVISNLNGASRAVMDYGQCEFWVNIELFSTDGQYCSKQRILEQINIASAYSPVKLACFSISHYAIGTPFFEIVDQAFIEAQDGNNY